MALKENGSMETSFRATSCSEDIFWSHTRHRGETERHKTCDPKNADDALQIVSKKNRQKSKIFLKMMLEKLLEKKLF